MYHYVYKLEEIETGEFYFGSRSSRNHPSLDCYMGSMKVWKPDKKKLIKTILKDDFDCRELAIEYEKTLISENLKHLLNRNYSIPDEKFYIRQDFYSLKEHGKGDKNSQFGTCWIHNSNGERKKIKRNKILPNGWFYGRSIKYDYIQLSIYDENKQMTSEKKYPEGGGQKGENNSQFGTYWITNGIETKKIKKDNFVPEGWRYGCINKKMKGCRWITNGLENKKLTQSQLPENWYYGYTSKYHNKKFGTDNWHFGTRWITDGKDNKVIKQKDMIPEGWSLGRTTKYVSSE